MMHYFYGEDTYAARQAIQTLAREKQARVWWLDTNDLQDMPLTEWAGQSHGLFGAQIPVVRDVSLLPKALQETIAATTEVPGEVVLWDRGVPDRRSVLFKSLKSRSREFATPPLAQLVGWLQAEVAALPGAIEPAAASLLIERCGFDRWRILAEVEKLVLVHTPVTTAAVEAAVARAPEAEIFATLTALLQKQKATAMAHVYALLESGHSELYMLSMLAWQFRVLAQIKKEVEAGNTVHDIVRHTHLKLFVVEKSLPFARRVSLSYLLDSLTKILATDFAIKQGKIDPRTGLTMLCLGLLA